MSTKTVSKGVRLLPGTEMQSPPYFYQKMSAKGGSVSATRPKTVERKFQELQNFVPQVD